MYSSIYGIFLKDSVIDGLNMEVSPKKTMWRRAGNSVFNSQTFNATFSTVGFSPVSSTGESFLVIADEAAAVYNATGNGRVLLFTKAAGAGPTRFQQVGNRLFAGDGISNWVWNWFPAWTATTSYPQGEAILDANNNIQQSLGFGVQIVSTSVTSDVLTVNYSGTGVVNVGDQGAIYGATTETQLNGISLTVLSTSAGSFTATFDTDNYSTTSDTGVFAEPGRSGTSGGSVPSFSGTIGSVLLDGTVAWQSKGFSVQNFGIAAPTVAPTVQNTPLSTLPNWVANTYYWPSPLIIDSNSGTGPWIWNLTTSGTTHSSVPSGLTTGTPTPTYSNGAISASPTTVTDGTAVWTCNSLAARQTSTKYSSQQVIMVSWTYVFYTYFFRNGTLYKIPHSVSNLNFFECTTPGTSSSAATSTIWTSSAPAALGATVVDGGVTWTNVGYEITRTSGSTVSPEFVNDSGVTAGNVGDSLLVSTNTQIQPSSTVTDLQGVTVAGESNSSIPAFPANAVPPASPNSNAGKTTVETSGLTWVDQGSGGSAQTAGWVYAYTWANSSTGDESNGSPLSAVIIEGANSGIQISGPGSPDPQVDTIRIYRSTLGLTVPFFLTSFPAPANGASWSYVDPTNDPGTPGSTLDVAITCPGYLDVDGIITNPNFPPPAGLTNLVFNAGYMFGSVGNVVYWATGPLVTSGQGTTAWNPLNFSQTPGDVTRMVATTQGLFVFTISGLYLIYGTGSVTAPFTTPQSLDTGIALAHYDAVDNDGATIFAYSSDSVLYSIQPGSGNEDIGWKIADVLKATFDPSTAGLCFYREGSDDVGLYIHDFSSQWYRVSNAPAPETGYCLSPVAQIQGGISSINRIQTAAGVYSMLIGPKVSGPILQRDTTGAVFTDNGESYDAFAVIGSIPLAKPGQTAAIEFIGIDAIKTGSVPTVSLLLDNFSRYDGTNGLPTTPAFTNLTNSVTDPKLVPSDTLYILRYYAVQSGKSVLCQSAQFKFDFSNDTVRNELLSYTIYGFQINE